MFAEMQARQAKKSEHACFQGARGWWVCGFLQGENKNLAPREIAT